MGYEIDEWKYKCEWKPQKDITVYELALCVKYIPVNVYSILDWDELDKSITRHFNVSKFNYGAMIKSNADKLKDVFGDGDLW